MTDDDLSPEDQSRADAIRALLLEVTPESGTLGDYNAGQRRSAILDAIGFCRFCGVDVRRPDGTDRRCSCWNDE